VIYIDFEGAEVGFCTSSWERLGTCHRHMAESTQKRNAISWSHACGNGAARQLSAFSAHPLRITFDGRTNASNRISIRVLSVTRMACEHTLIAADWRIIVSISGARFTALSGLVQPQVVLPTLWRYVRRGCKATHHLQRLSRSRTVSETQ
jgi:hypothetical protein